MNKHTIKGSVLNAKGKIKEEAGNLTGDTRLEADGILDQVKAKIEKVAGDVKDTVKQGVDKILHR